MKSSDRLAAVLIASATVASALAYRALPARVLVPWQHQPHSSRLLIGVMAETGRTQAVVAAPIIMIVVWACASVLPRVDPRRKNYEAFAATYWLLVTVLLLMIALLHIVILMKALGFVASVRPYAACITGGAMMIVGNYLTRVRSNWFLGFRTPWALSDDRVWQSTNRLAAWLLVIAGLTVCVAGTLTDVPLVTLVAVFLATIAAATMIFSYLRWRQLHDAD